MKLSRKLIPSLGVMKSVVPGIDLTMKN